MRKISVGSVCSGIEAASVAWSGLEYTFSWFSEIADFPSKLLKQKYPKVINIGDMCAIPNKLSAGEIESPDLICAGTPCQAFSLAGWKKGLEDSRGNLTLKFVDIVDENDRVRAARGCSSSVILWENVEGVLRDKTNAFGIFISSLAGLESEIPLKKLPQAGLIRGPKRNVAWRVLDAKYFGLPQQRRRLYLLAGGKDFFPENVLFDEVPDPNKRKDIETQSLLFDKQGQSIEVFREYTDCLYSADLLLSVSLLHSFLLVRGNSTSFWCYLGGADHSLYSLSRPLFPVTGFEDPTGTVLGRRTEFHRSPPSVLFENISCRLPVFVDFVGSITAENLSVFHHLRGSQGFLA